MQRIEKYTNPYLPQTENPSTTMSPPMNQPMAPPMNQPMAPPMNQPMNQPMAQPTLPYCTNTSSFTASNSMEMCMCPTIPQIQKLDSVTNKWFCQ